ncbi:hypothetical protein Pla111_05000 [Botrimarina hoheduenensis]|uniref:Uncharacterized protein n=1 Tax=Botrimarina hoheduenensis TaxID=2528000 RepID=A0A5C5WF78_9BACT|nr:hypothetical protein Pla111_05000 [Botrimarina hoheduenensis]
MPTLQAAIAGLKIALTLEGNSKTLRPPCPRMDRTTRRGSRRTDSGKEAGLP